MEQRAKLLDSENIYVTKPSMPSLDDYISEITDLWASGILTNGGIKHEALEAQLLDMMKVPYISLFTNGHLGLEAAFYALNLHGEVITTPFTFVSTTLAIARSNLKPVFCDIDEKSFTIDPRKIESLITEKTSAIVPVHVYGNVCNVDAIEKIAHKYNLKVIYDAAHSFGETLNRESVASFGDASMLSFNATKVFNTGEGGAVISHDPEVKKRLDAWKYYGFQSSGGDVDFLGTNAKMTEFAAALGLCNLRHLSDDLRKRTLVFRQYSENLKDLDGVKMCKLQPGVQHNHAYFPVVLDSKKYNRDEVVNRLNKAGIFPRKYFYPLASEFGCFEYLDIKDPAKETPFAYKASREVMTLPIYADLSSDDVSRVCSSLIEALN